MGYLQRRRLAERARSPKTRDGDFQRKDSVCRNWITADGAPGPTGGAASPRRAGATTSMSRYACPWAHRTLIFRALKGLGRARRASTSCIRSWATTAGPSTPASPARPATGCSASASCARSMSTPTRRYRPGDRAGALGPGDRHASSRTSRPRSSGCSTRPSTRITGNTLDFSPQALRAGDRRGQRPRLRRLEQRRLPRRLRPHQAAYDEAAAERVRDARLARGAAGARRCLVGDRLTEADWRLRDHALPLRRGLPRPLQVQPPAARRLPEPLGLRARALPAARASPARCDFDHITWHYYREPRARSTRAGSSRSARTIDWRAPHGAGAAAQPREPPAPPRVDAVAARHSAR